MLPPISDHELDDQPQPPAGTPAAQRPVQSQQGTTGWIGRLMPWRSRQPIPLDMARKALQEQSYSVAMAHYEEALRQAPDSVEARRGMALVLLHKGGRENLQSALSHIEVALRTSPYRSGLYRIRAMIFANSGLIERAKLEKRNAAVIAGLSALPMDPGLNNLTGIVMNSLQLYELATEHFRRAIRAMPNHDVFERNLAVVLYRKALAQTRDADRAELLAGALAEALHAAELKRTGATLQLVAMIYQASGAYERALHAIDDAQAMGASLSGVLRLRSEVNASIEQAARFAVGDVADPAVERMRAARNRTARIDANTG